MIMFNRTISWFLFLVCNITSYLLFNVIDNFFFNTKVVLNLFLFIYFSFFFFIVQNFSPRLIFWYYFLDLHGCLEMG